jgi:hypothetical protein
MTDRAKKRTELGHAVLLLQNAELRMRMNFRQRHNLYPINEEENYNWPSFAKCYKEFKAAKRDRTYAHKRIARLTEEYRAYYKT